MRRPQEIHNSVSLFYVNIRIYRDISDKEWLPSLVSYLELVDCMDRKCHEIVYMKSWPNMDSKLWTCSTHSLGTPIRAHPACWNLLKPAWPCANPACANADTLACRLTSALTTAEPLFLLSSQGGYTVAHCQKEISCWRTHTHSWSYILRELQPRLQIHRS